MSFFGKLSLTLHSDIYKYVEKFPQGFSKPENEELYQACKDMNIDKVIEILKSRKKK